VRIFSITGRFIGDSGGPEYVIVRGARFPAKDPALPDNAREIAANCAKALLRITR